MGNAKASRRGTGNKYGSHAFFIHKPIKANEVSPEAELNNNFMKKLQNALPALCLALAALAVSCGGKNQVSEYYNTGRTADLIPVKNEENGKWGYIDAAGKLVIEPQFAEAAYFQEGKAYVKDTTGLCGYINSDGTYAIEPRYASATDFGDGLAWVAEPDSALKTIDAKGNTVFRFPDAAAAFTFMGGYAIYISNSETKGIVDTKGIDITLPESTTGLYFRGNDIVMLKGDDYQGYKPGRIKNGAVELLAKDLSMTVTDVNSDFRLLIIELDDKYGLADFDGNIIVNPRFKKLGFDSDGMLIFCNDKDKYGWINTKGEEVIKPKYKEVAADFRTNGYASVSTSGTKFQIIDRKGNTVFGAKFEKVYPTWTGDIFLAHNDEGWGLIKADGTVVCPPQFKGIACVREGLFMATSGEHKWGVISESGAYQGAIDFNSPDDPTWLLSGGAQSQFFSPEIVAPGVDKLKKAAVFDTTFGKLAKEFDITKSNLKAYGSEVTLKKSTISRLGVQSELKVVLNSSPLAYPSRYSYRQVLNESARPLAYTITVTSDTEAKNAALFNYFREHYNAECSNPEVINNCKEFTIYLDSSGSCLLQPDYAAIESYDQW